MTPAMRPLIKISSASLTATAIKVKKDRRRLRPRSRICYLPELSECHRGISLHVLSTTQGRCRLLT